MPNYNRPNEECNSFLSKKLPHYHTIYLNDEIKTTGRVDRNHEFKYMGLDGAAFSDRSVLDVGAFDGVLSFGAEKLGASKVLAIDVEDPSMQDWGWDKAPENFANLGDVKNRIFPELKRFFSSNVERKKMTLYQLSPKEHGPFDLIFL